jgi:hypothetical protein
LFAFLSLAEFLRQLIETKIALLNIFWEGFLSKKNVKMLFFWNFHKQVQDTVISKRFFHHILLHQNKTPHKFRQNVRPVKKMWATENTTAVPPD